MSDFRERWQLQGPYGTEIWYSEHGRFIEVMIGGRTIALTGGEDDLDLVPARHAQCSHGGAWPHAFRFCPQCGKALGPKLPLPTAEAWSAPFGPASGLPLIDDVRVPDPESRREETLPGPASLSFVVAGTPPRLFAIDLQTGWLHERTGARTSPAGGWAQRQRLKLQPGMPRWQFCAAALPNGFALPGEAGPIWVTAEAAQPIAVMPAPQSLGLAGSRAGAAVLRGGVAIPVSSQAGFSVALRSPEGIWHVAPVEGGAPRPGEWLAVPVTHGGDAIWCGSSGMLHVRADAVADVTAVWRAWRPGLQPLLGVRPIIAPDGTLHQLARAGADDLVWEYLAPPGGPAARRAADGIWLSVGQAAFREGRSRRLPWDGVTRLEFTLDDGEFLLPLLGLTAQHFVLAICQDRDSLLAFIGAEDPTAGEAQDAAQTRRCRLMFSLATRRLLPLGRAMEAARASDLVSCVFRDRLYVYAASSNQCSSWALREDTAA